MVLSLSRITCFFVIIISSCGIDNVKPLALTDDQLVEIIADMHYVTAASDLYPVLKRDSMKNVFQNQVFEIHGIQKTAYDESMSILQKDLNHFFIIEERVQTYLKDLNNSSN